MNKPVRAALYARVSTTGHGQDVGLQVDALRRLAETRGWSPVEVYVDEAVSGAKDSRPALDRTGQAGGHRLRARRGRVRADHRCEGGVGRHRAYASVRSSAGSVSAPPHPYWATRPRACRVPDSFHLRHPVLDASSKQRGVHLVAELVDEGVSGAITSRPGFDAMMRADVRNVT